MKRFKKVTSIVRERGVLAFLLFFKYRLVLDAVRFLSRLIWFGRGKTDPTTKLFDSFLDEANGITHSRILELGSRNISHKHLFRAYSEHVGFDINPGPNVDVAGDIHRLSESVPGNHFDVVYAISVFEHLAMPWKAVLEINKVLKPGGMLFIYTHHAFPLHAEPWDFWRFSRHAFPILLNEETGFEIVDCVQGLPCVVLPLEKSKATRLTHRVLSFMGVAVLARKRFPASSSLAWSLDVNRAVRTTYPAKYSDDVKAAFFDHLNARETVPKKR